MTVMEEREQIRKAVLALELCWRCQRVSECALYLLGNVVKTWLCRPCAEAVIEARGREGAAKCNTP